MESRENGERAVRTLRTFVTGMELQPEEELTDEVAVFRLSLDGPTPKAVARILIAGERFTVHFYFKGQVPEAARTPAAEYITRANYGLVTGNFEMDLETGTLRFKVGIDFSNAELTEPLIRNAMLSAMDNLEAFAGPLVAVLDGTLTPAAAHAAARAKPD
jgi:hypothetical protein